MIKNIKLRFKVWNRWRKACLNGPVYKFLVLVGLANSPTFRVAIMTEEVDDEFGLASQCIKDFSKETEPDTWCKTCVFYWEWTMKEKECLFKNVNHNCKPDNRVLWRPDKRGDEDE